MRRLLCLVLLVLFVGPTTAAAQSASEGGPWSVQTGIGFTADPDAFLLGFELDYRLTGGLSVGGELQLGLDDHFTLVSPTARVRYSFDLRSTTRNESLQRLKPFVQSGLGFTYINLDLPNLPGVDDDDIGFMLNFGMGVDYALTRSVSLGSKMLFNILPSDVFGEDFYFSWEVAALRYRF